jgi:hypothetical protein
MQVMHGTALLYPHLVRNTPHWFLPEGGFCCGSLSSKESSESHDNTGMRMTPVNVDEVQAARELEQQDKVGLGLP